MVALAGEARALLPRARQCPQLQPLPNGGWLCVAGIGACRARKGAEELLAAGVNALVSWGSAAGLDPGLAPGDLVLPTEISAGPARPPVAVDLDWQARVRRRLERHVTLYSGPLVQSSVILASAAAKRELRQASAALAADMESAAVAMAARAAGVPFLAIRTIADGAGTNLPRAALVALDERGRLRPWPLLAALLSRPGEWPMVIRLARDFAAARCTLRLVGRQAGLASSDSISGG